MRSKSLVPYSEFDPLIPDSLTKIEEIATALGFLRGLDQDDMKPYQMILRGLKSGDLVMKSHKTKTTISSDSWRNIDGDLRQLKQNHLFWNGTIIFRSTCKGFQGHLPVIETNDAVKWLIATKPVGKDRNVGRPREQERSAEIYFELFGVAGHAAHAIKSKAEAHRRVNAKYAAEHGKPISFSTFARAMGWKN